MKREDVLAMCEGKKKLTFEVAKKVARRKSDKTTRRDFYKCPVCRRWHVGRKP